MCNSCQKIRPIDVNSWQLINIDPVEKDEYDWCKCMISHNDHATEQDVRMYKFVWNKISKIRSDNKVGNVSYC